MRRNELIVRTGLARGRIYNGTGENLTDTPGAGNFNVGSWCLDFSHLWGDQDVPANTDPDLTRWDNEYTIVLADGRGLEHDDLDDDATLDLDEGNPEEDTGAFVTEEVRWARIDGIDVEMHFHVPNYDDASVYYVEQENGEIGAVIDELSRWLDRTSIGDSEIALEGDVWDRNRSQLRWSLHWAIMVIDCANNADEGITNYTENNNDALALPNNPVPLGGPGGLVSVMGGAALNTPQGVTTHTRLWSPNEGAQGVRFVKRGQSIHTYTLPGDTDNPTDQPDDVHDVDVLEMDLNVVEHHGYSQPAVDTVRGRSVRLRVNFNQKITVRDDQLVVFCVQSGRARLFKGVGSNGSFDGVIAGPTLINGRGGPLIKPFYWYARVRGETR